MCRKLRRLPPLGDATRRGLLPSATRKKEMRPGMERRFTGGALPTARSTTCINSRRRIARCRSRRWCGSPMWATANPPLFASRTADLLWTTASSIFLLPPLVKLNRLDRALCPSAWKWFRLELIPLRDSLPYRLARSATATTPNGFASGSTHPIRRFSFSSMILPTAFSTACASERFPARTPPNNSANNSATAKDSRRWFCGWMKARPQEEPNERELPFLQDRGETDPIEDCVRRSRSFCLRRHQSAGSHAHPDLSAQTFQISGPSRARRSSDPGKTAACSGATCPRTESSRWVPNRFEQRRGRRPDRIPFALASARRPQFPLASGLDSSQEFCASRRSGLD